MVSAYFQLAGAYAAYGSAVLAFVIFDRGAGRTSGPTNAYVGLIGAALLAAGFFRTSRLLSRRRKTGAQLAALCFAGPLVGCAAGAAPGLASIAIAGCGLALVASVWRYLE